MKILIDMNLSPDWKATFQKHGWEALHWSEIGEATAKDRVIMAWAVSHGYAVFTHDLDFSTILAVSRASGPSVVQIRTQDLFPSRLESLIVDTLRQYQHLLEAGALVVIDESRARVRILPL